MAETVQGFIAEIAPLIVAEGKKRGYSVFSATIAQSIIESRHGESKLSLPPNYNYFGLKAGSAWLKAGKPYVSMKTKEEYTVGNLTTITDAFRKYGSMAEGVAGYYDFIATKRYANLKTAKNYIEFANYLKSDGYATSSSYVNTICSTVTSYSLQMYDSANPMPIPTPQTIEGYTIGKTYTTQSDLYIRDAANGEKVDWFSITTNAQINAFTDPNGFSILRKGTRVTCKAIKKIGSTVWMNIPSGWICAKNSKNVYIK